MARIGQKAAQSAAENIAKPIDVKAKEVYKEMQELVIEQHLKQLPAEVITIYEKYPEYVCKTYNFKINGIGIVQYYISLPKAYPSKNGYTSYLELDKKHSEKFTKLRDKYDDLEKKYKDTKKEIEALILNLGTHKRIAEQLPDALRFLPEVDGNLGLMVVPEATKDKIKCLIGTSEVKKCMETVVLA